MSLRFGDLFFRFSICGFHLLQFKVKSLETSNYFMLIQLSRTFSQNVRETKISDWNSVDSNTFDSKN